MSENKRNTILETSTYNLDRYGFTIEELQKEKESFLKLYPDVIPDTVRFKVNCYEYYGGMDWDYYITGYRLETDDEYNKRLEKNLKIKQASKDRAIKEKKAKEARDLAEYERLRKKFG